MKIEDIVTLSRSQTIESILIPRLWLSRTAVTMRTKSGRTLPIFGFGSDFNAELSLRKATFELIEHLSFHPQKPLLSDVVKLSQRSNGRWRHSKDVSIDCLLLGARNFGETLHGNGCAVHTSLREAASHAENEALERHYCCEMWYNRSIRPRRCDFDFPIDPRFRNCVTLYELDNPSARHLIISIIDVDSLDFFCMGASMKFSRDAAIGHCMGEAATLLEDAFRLRAGHAPTTAAATNILSLRDRKLSQDRKHYFLSLLNNNHCPPEQSHAPTIYAFRTIDNLIAARASTTGLLTPRRFHCTRTDTPTMPLF